MRSLNKQPSGHCRNDHWETDASVTTSFTEKESSRYHIRPVPGSEFISKKQRKPRH